MFELIAALEEKCLQTFIGLSDDDGTRRRQRVIRGAMGINNVTPLMPKEKELAS